MPSDASHFDPAPFVEGLRRANELERRETATRAHAAREEATRLAREIGVSGGGARRVFLFGSLLADVPRNPGFDIDLAVDGDVYSAMEVCEHSEWAVDLVDLHRVQPSVADRIVRTGRLLWPESEPA